ncbi:MAG: SDR family oxidoreductase [Cyclobacteriaceae bacterium]
MNQSGKVVIITGGNSGIGKALAIKYAKQGARIVLTGRNEERLKGVEAELKAINADYLALKADAASDVDNQRVIDATISKFGKIDTLICNAGISMRALFEELDLEVFKKVMDINFWGTVYLCKAALPYILESKGSIIGISSINGHRGTPARSAYTASKFAMEGFFESLRTEVMKKGVHILVVSPGFTGTNIRNAALTAGGSSQGESPRNEEKMMTAEEVADKVYSAHKKKKRDLVLTSQGKLVVFLNKWMPATMDKLVYNAMAKEEDSPFK